MHALVIQGFYLDLILSGRKTWEMRSRSSSVRGLIGLIPKGSGTVTGVVELFNVRGELTSEELALNTDRHCIPEDRQPEAVAKRWLVPLELRGARRLVGPVPYVHRKGWMSWVPLSVEIEAAVMEQITDEARAE